MNRRNFLLSIGGIGVGALLSSYANAEKVISEEIKTDIEDLINLEKLKKYEKSISSVGQREVEFFMGFFGISNEEDKKIKDFVLKVKELQKEFKFPEKSQDGVLGSFTLRKIYLEYYIKNPDKLDKEIKSRLDIYNEMLGYSKKSGALYKGLDVYKHMTYFGKDVGINIKGTYINEKIFGKVPQEIDDKINKIIVKKYEDKKILIFYINGELYLATFVSPGLLKYKTSKLKTKGKLKPELYHTSSEYPEAEKKKNGVKGGAIMPYAVHIDGSIWIHGSDGNIDGNPQSHGCIRTPLLYMREIYDKVKELGINNVVIDTTGIY